MKKKDAAEERMVAVEEALSKSEHFIENNQKIITYIVGGLIVLVLAYFGYQKFIQLPKEKAAQTAMFKAEYYFEKDSLNLALNGDGESYGFLDIIDDYGSTDAGNLAKYYSGICYLNLGNYEEAIDYLKRFSGAGEILPGMATGAIGDAYMQLGNIDKAIKYYMEAADDSENEFISPSFMLKAGWSYELAGEWEKAHDVYNRIKKEYPKSREARDIDKAIAKAKAHLGML